MVATKPANPIQDWVKELSVKQAKIILNAKGIDSSQVVEKAHLLKLVNENIESKAVGDKLMKEATASTKVKAENNTTPESSPEQHAAAQAILQNFLNLPPKQLAYQAQVMKRDPDYVRRKDKSLAGATNEMILATALEMEKKAELLKNNPSEIQKQEDMARANQFYDMLINHPNQFKKQLFSTMPAMKIYEKQLDEPYDSLRSVAKSNEKGFKWYIVKGISVLRTLQEAFNILQKLTFGNAKIVILILFLMISYAWIKLGWFLISYIYGFLFRSHSSSTSSSSITEYPEEAPVFSDVEVAAPVSVLAEERTRTRTTTTADGEPQAVSEDEWGF
jgi:hypothetical protein